MYKPNELQPIPIAAGTVLPVIIPIYFSIGKRPIISVYIKNADGSTTSAPNVTTTEYRNSDDYVTSFTVNDADGGDGHAADNLVVVIHPQSLSICV